MTDSFQPARCQPAGTCQRADSDEPLRRRTPRAVHAACLDYFTFRSSGALELVLLVFAVEGWPRMDWTYVLDDAALPEGTIAPVYPAGVNIVITRVDGAVYAVSGRCAHMACPLSLATLSGHTLTCSCHDWRFDVRTGRFLDAPELGVATYAVKSEAGKLFIGLKEDER
jgi:nitrite reductase/ring-hydroxylating ferredoxin subunit